MNRNSTMPGLALVTVIGSFAVVFALGVPALAQSSVASKSALSSKPAAVSKAWRVPRTPDGHPDLQGVWNNNTVTPFERPNNLGDRTAFSEDEAATLQKQAENRFADRPPQPGNPGGYNQFWFDPPGKILNGNRSSLVIDPPDGRVPPITTAARTRQRERQAYASLHPDDGPEDRTLFERCLYIAGSGAPISPIGYNSNFRIVQGAGHVAILSEMIHEARVIPTDGSPHLPANIRSWMGDGRGHWEGDTLVVETTNFSGRGQFHGSDENLRVIERFTRVDDKTIDYRFTIDDPSAFTRPWTASVPMTFVGEGHLFEYACQEGNYALMDILSGARALEREAAAAGKK